tara:strand:- start:1527 stop:1793 length:267 start_codon:yes stop_codon:yes gene_type:complete
MICTGECVFADTKPKKNAAEKSLAGLCKVQDTVVHTGSHTQQCFVLCSFFLFSSEVQCKPPALYLACFNQDNTRISGGHFSDVRENNG